MKKAIVTGANGFVGRTLVRELLKHDVSVIALDQEGCFGNLSKDDRVRFLPLGLNKIGELKYKIPDRDIDIFYHFAWAGSAGPARSDTVLQLQNAQWTIDSLRAAKEINCKRFICAGSIMEKETTSAAFSQGSKPGMGYIYGGGKLIAHCMSKSVAAQIDIEHIWAVITNAYGEGEKSPRFVYTTIHKILNNEPLQFTSGTQYYDFVHVEDVARAFYLIGENGKPFHEYIIGSSNARPLKEFILEMKRSLAPQREFIFGDVPFSGTDLSLSAFDCSDTEKDTGFRAHISFFDGVRRTMEWIKAEVENDSKI